MSYIIDKTILFYWHILTSCSTSLCILANHKQGFILSLLAKYNIPSLLSSDDTINHWMWNNFASKTVTAGYISTTCQQLFVLYACTCICCFMCNKRIYFM